MTPFCLYDIVHSVGQENARGRLLRPVFSMSNDLRDGRWHIRAMQRVFIKEWRESVGMTQQELGDAINPPASAGTISSYESGARNLSMERLRQVAVALGTTRGALLDFPPAGERKASGAGEGEVFDLWHRIKIEDRPRALRALKVFVDEG